MIAGDSVEMMVFATINSRGGMDDGGTESWVE